MNALKNLGIYYKKQQNNEKLFKEFNNNGVNCIFFVMHAHTHIAIVQQLMNTFHFILLNCAGCYSHWFVFRSDNAKMRFTQFR